MRTDTVPGLVSAIIPVFNRPRMLEDAVDSVLAQTYRPIEIIVVDDGSTDETPFVAAKLAALNSSVKVFRQENAGPGPARNLGLEHASGEFIQYLDSDDALLPEKFSRQVECLMANPRSGVSYCIAKRTGKFSRVAASYRTGEAFERILPEFLCVRGWPTVAPLWRHVSCYLIGPWSDLRVMEDWEYDCRAGLVGVHPIHVPEALCEVRDHGEHRASGGGAGYGDGEWNDYLSAHESIFEKLLVAGRKDYLAVPFGRGLFRVARECAIKGYRSQAIRAYALAERTIRNRSDWVKLSVFRVMASLIGWRRAAILSEAGWKRTARYREARFHA